ncbi:DEAD/DEAH box helicase [Brucella sp. IR073]|uniref:DEAD/DEAH box helicase n=1 Tax=unclassified Brucella TaxID=2632610 RepID=UPI003B97FB12
MTLPSTIAPALSGALTARGYTALTSVQTAMLDPQARDADLLVSAQTGSGKTVAFGLAIAPTLLDDAERFDNPGAPLALVIAPTRELALQVRRELEWLYADAGARIASCVGGMDIRTERRALERGAHIVVGTPGRLRDHITRGAFDMSALRAVVLDEADEMLDLGFREDLEFILGEAPDDRRTLLFSATVPAPIAQLAKRFQRDALRISATSEKEQHGDISYQAMLVEPRERENAIINTLLFFEAQNTIIFCSTREAVKHLTSRLTNRGFAVVALSGELSQAERTNALQSMRDGRARVCVATDVAARGIDLPNLDLVIHADLPTNPETLLHRSGRTGRAGRKGTCVLVVPFSRRRAAERLLQMAKLKAVSVSAPGISAIQEKVKERILNDPTLSEAADEDMLDLVRELQSLYSPEQIAAAYLRRELASRPAPEEISDVPVRPLGQDRKTGERTGKYEQRTGGYDREGRGEREERPAKFMDDGVWFSLSLGRKQRADPRWLLPMICKAGDVTKRDVGSIQILETETRFEIARAKAGDYLATLRERGTGEKGVAIRPVDGGTPAPHSRKERPAPKAKSWQKRDGAEKAYHGDRPAKAKKKFRA